ncbi:MAG: DUF302 domain-containing protein [Phaeodactylibacter sp.]|nr:DUF302 domain-containing protein [Phaeodactylibacter sp.]MCB9303589.1 DUF302 domain-containing protein [Lewinellaceae bacterium]
MAYYFSKKLDVGFEEAIQKVTAALKEQGFGIITEIDMKTTFKNKLDADIRPYRILGACNPHFAYQALQLENKVGTMLPCNVIVQQLEDGSIEVAAVDPIASMSAVENEQLGNIAHNVQSRMREVVEGL